MEDKLVPASDGGLALKIKPHTIRKLKVIKYYLAEFATAMRPKPPSRVTGFRGFAERNYIDLFAGPGRCRVLGSSVPSELREVDGSPLIALKVRYPLSNYYFIDIEPRANEALKQRVAETATARGAEIRFLDGDCNEKVNEVLRHVDAKNSINVALVDSFTIACKWSTVKALARCKMMDLIINFPMGMSISRNLHYWVENEASALDDFFGNRKWRDIYEREHRVAKKCIRPFLDLYEQGLAELGYRVGEAREIPIRSQKGVPLYYLVFASRRDLGDKFWNNAARVADDRQLRMFD